MTSMFDKKVFEDIETGYRKWNKELSDSFAASPERLERFATVSDLEIQRIYTPADLRDQDFSRDLGFPGAYPFTRGVQPSMYRGRLWTMRMFAGLGSARDTNRRFHLLVKEGQTGLSTAFRHAHPDGLRHGFAQGPRGMRQVRGGHRHAQGHGGPFRRACPSTGSPPP